MEIDYPHKLDQEEAQRRIEVLGEYLFNRHGIRVAWSEQDASFSGKYLMIKIEGRLKVEESRIHFEGKDPGALWRKKAINYLTEKLDLYLDPATPLADLPRRK